MCLLAELLHLDVLAVVATYGNARINDVRYLHLNLADLLTELRLLLLERSKLLCLLGDELLHLLRLVALSLTHQRSDLLADLIAVCAQLARAGVSAALFGIERNKLVDEGQLRVLEFLLYIFLNKLGIVAYKFDVKHALWFLSFYFRYQLC